MNEYFYYMKCVEKVAEVGNSLNFHEKSYNIGRRDRIS